MDSYSIELALIIILLFIIGLDLSEILKVLRRIADQREKLPPEEAATKRYGTEHYYPGRS